MGKYDTVKLSKVIKLLANHGVVFKRQSGSHMIFTREGLRRPLVIAPHKKEIYCYNLKEICQALNISLEAFLAEIKKL
jgi:predicted RNA binding protein YcfA (HicA-like mRNA interferase family)